MRLFLAIEIPDVEKEKLIEFAKRIKVNGKVKWVEKENLHITLLFLGEQEPRIVIDCLEGIQKEFKPFAVKLSKFGAFPSMSRPRVLWVGVGKGGEEIYHLHERVYKKLSHLVKPENRFVPHVTIGRLKYGKVVVEDDEIHNPHEFNVREIVLFKSKLTRDGPVYTPIKRFVSGGED